MVFVVRHVLQHGLDTAIDFLAQRTVTDLGVDPALKVMRRDLARWHRANGELGHGRVPNRRDRGQGVRRTGPFLLGDPQSFGAEPVGVDDGRGPTKGANHMGKLLLGPVGTEDLVEAEQVRGVGFTLELVTVPGEAQTDQGDGRIARLTYTGSGGYIFPSPAKIGIDIFKPIERVLNAIFSFESARGNMANPTRVDGVETADYRVIEVLRTARKEISKATA